VFRAPSPRNEIESTRISFLVLKKIGKIYGGKTHLGTGISKDSTFFSCFQDQRELQKMKNKFVGFATE